MGIVSKTIVLISSGQPSLNPRLVKEADTLAENGCHVTVLYAYWNEWGTLFDKELISSKKWAAVRIGGDPLQQPVIFFLSRMVHRLARALSKATNAHLFAELAITRSAYFLIRATKRYPADLYIAHNLGALPAAVKAAKFNKKPCGFDAEDFHRYEIVDDERHPDVILKSKLESTYIPQVTYLSASSELIGIAYQRLFADKHLVIVRNLFPRFNATSRPRIDSERPIRLFWFSQTIGHGRGLEQVFEALKILKPYSFELHLLGNINDKVRHQFIKEFPKTQKVSIHFYRPISPDSVLQFSSRFDIGLATETGIPLNRDICLTNKIFTYLQAGLCVVASDTTAQEAFLAAHQTVGKNYIREDCQSLAEVLLYYYQNRDKLAEARLASLKLAHDELNWEKESKKFLACIKQTLGSY